MTEPGHSSRACRPLFIACEHYWPPLLLLRLVIHRFRCTAPATQGNAGEPAAAEEKELPPAHAQVMLVIRTWLETSRHLFAVGNETSAGTAGPDMALSLELRSFLESLSSLGGLYTAAVREIEQLSLQPCALAPPQYSFDYSRAEHQQLYEVRCIACIYSCVNILPHACAGRI